jgi:hypothetical protein
VNGYAELPAIAKKDGDYITGMNSGGDHAVCQTVDDFAELCIAKPAAATRIYNRGLCWTTPTGLEDQIMKEAVVRIRVEFGSQPSVTGLRLRVRLNGH